MKIAHENGLPIRSVCNGLPSCAECRVNILEGENNLLSPTGEELALIGTGYFVDHRRLSCQLKCFGDVVVDLSEQVEKEKKQGHRRPQGHYGKGETENSLAVTGNLIDSDKDLLQQPELAINEDSVSTDDNDGDVLAKELRKPSRRKNNDNKGRNSKRSKQNAKSGSGRSSHKGKRDGAKPNSEGKKPNRNNRRRNRPNKNKSTKKTEG